MTNLRKCVWFLVFNLSISGLIHICETECITLTTISQFNEQRQFYLNGINIRNEVDWCYQLELNIPGYCTCSVEINTE